MTDGLGIHLAEARDRELLLDLARGADLLIETFSPGHLDALGLGYAALCRANPRLVLTSITGFGQTGPRRGWRSSDLVATALGGAAGVIFVRGFHWCQEKLKIDDVLGVWPLHGLCGLWGGIACGIFGQEALGGMGGVSLPVQLIGSIGGAAGGRISYKMPRLEMKDYNGPAGLPAQPAAASIIEVDETNG